MKISLNWLSDFVDIAEFLPKSGGRPEALAEVLTRAGLEVEEIQDRSKDFAFVQVGYILEKDKHPNADKLSLCKVTTGEGVIHQIVCGAQNHKAHDRVVVALPGAVLPGNFAIKKAAVRGVESGGMLCSWKELGLPERATSDGIVILEENAPIGKDFAEYMGLDDVVFELKVTPNRADCLSHFGLAREVACLLKKPLNETIRSAGARLNLDAGSTRDQISLVVEDKTLCPRYAGRYIEGVKVGPSPEWLKKRLEAVGLNSINNVVDVTNYVMLEMGQPLHAFDVRFLEGSAIKVARAHAGEKFTTLDGSEIALSGEELTIRDAQKPVALAGVVGGKNSGILDDTQNVFLEAAFFAPMSVRKTSRRHGIETDSAYRFSRGVDRTSTVTAMDRATELILQVAGGKAFAQHWDDQVEAQSAAPIEISAQMISDRLGYECKDDLLRDFLVRLGCQLETAGGVYKVIPPAFRFDISMEMDLVEEYARLNGYEHIPEALPVFASAPEFHNKVFMLDQNTSKMMRAEGYSEARNFAFVGKAAERKMLGSIEALRAAGLSVSEDPIQILNPLNEDLNVMRSSLTYGLVRNMLHNVHQGNLFGRLFEVGETFHNKEGHYVENHRLGLMAWGFNENLWNKNPAHSVVFEIKAAVESLLRYLRITAYTWAPVERGQAASFLHLGQNAHLIVEGKKIGFIGSLHPVLLEEEKVRVPVAMAEIDLEGLYKTQPRSYRVSSLSKFPAVERDFAFVMSKQTRVGDVVKEIRKLGGALVRDVSVFDLYQGEKLPQGQKSVAFRILLQDNAATLQDSVVQEVSNKIVEGLKEKLSVSMR